MIVFIACTLVFLISAFMDSGVVTMWSGLIALIACTSFLLTAKLDNKEYVEYLKRRDKKKEE